MIVGFFDSSGDDEGDIYQHEKENERVTDSRGTRESNPIDKAAYLGGRLQDQDHRIHVLLKRTKRDS